MRKLLVFGAMSWCVIVTAACGDDEAAADTMTTGDATSAADATSTGDTTSTATGDADASEGPPLTPCEQACVTAHPTGAALLDAWFTCQEEACADEEPGSAAAEMCINGTWDPANPTAACAAETERCFSNTDGGCNELIDLAAVACEPEQLPMDEEQLGMAGLCMIELGWNATPEVQALAWPLYVCAFFNEGEAGCAEECADGADACRACAATKCKATYDACEAHSTGTPITPAAVPADAEDCRAAFRCVMMCMP